MASVLVFNQEKNDWEKREKDWLTEEKKKAESYHHNYSIDSV